MVCMARNTRPIRSASSGVSSSSSREFQLREQFVRLFLEGLPMIVDHPSTFFTTAISCSGLKGLTIQPVAPAAFPSCFFRVLGFGGEHDDRDELAGRGRPQPPDQADAVQVGHVEVGDEHVDGLFPWSFREGVLAVHRLHHLVAAPLRVKLTICRTLAESSAVMITFPSAVPFLPRANFVSRAAFPVETSPGPGRRKTEGIGCLSDNAIRRDRFDAVRRAAQSS